MSSEEERRYAIAREHFNLDTIRLLPTLRPKTPKQWEELAARYPLREAGRKLIQDLTNETLRLLQSKIPAIRLTPDVEVFPTRLPIERAGPHKVGKLNLYTTPEKTSGHSTVLIQQPDGKFHFFDPHGKTLEHPKSAMKYMKGLLDKLPGELTQCDMPGKFQGLRGTCQLWTMLRSLHPEKTDEEFYRMVIATQRRVGLPEKPVDINGTIVDENLDLIPIAIAEQIIRDGFPELVTPEERLEIRKGLGKRCKNCGLIKKTSKNR